MGTFLETKELQFARMYFPKSWLDPTTKSQRFENRFWPLFSEQVPGTKPGDLIDAWAQVHFSTDSYTKNSSAVSIALTISDRKLTAESPNLVGARIGIYPVQNVKPRNFAERGGGTDYDPIGAYLTLERRGCFTVRDGKPVFVNCIGFTRSFGAATTDYLLVGGGDSKSSDASNYAHLLIRHN